MCLAVPGLVEAIEDTRDALERTARVAFGPIRKTINVSLVPEVRVGDYVLVHVGVAIQRVDSDEAERVLALWSELEGQDPGGVRS